MRPSADPEAGGPDTQEIIMAGKVTTSTLFVISLPWRRAWRAPLDFWRDRRVARELAGATFARYCSTAGGKGSRHFESLWITIRRTGMLVEWESPRAAEEGIALLEAMWRRRGADVWRADLVPRQSKGTWRGQEAFTPADDAVAAPDALAIASLAFAEVKVRWWYTWYFKALVEADEAVREPTSGLIAGISLAGVPFREAATFSFWPADGQALRYAYGKSSPHSAIQRRAHDEGWFGEYLIARFDVVGASGSWAGSNPLAAQVAASAGASATDRLEAASD